MRTPSAQNAEFGSALVGHRTDFRAYPRISASAGGVAPDRQLGSHGDEGDADP